MEATEKPSKALNIKPKRKHIIEAFLFLEATEPDNPCTLKQLGLDLLKYASRINYLVKNKVIIQVKGEEEKYYLDFDAYKDFKESDDKKFFLLMVSIIIPGILFLLLGVAWIITAI